MIGLPRESCAAIRKDAASPATAEVRPSPVAWQHASDTCTAQAAYHSNGIQPALIQYYCCKDISLRLADRLHTSDTLVQTWPGA